MHISKTAVSKTGPWSDMIGQRKTMDNKFNWALTRLLWFGSPGVKNADENELRSIASDPDDIHMYNVADFSFLLDIVDDLTNNLCNSVKGPGITEVTLSKTLRLKYTVFLREKG